MSVRSQTRPAAVVLGLNPNALGTIRSLHAMKVPIIAVDVPPRSHEDVHRWMSCRTRLARKIFIPDDGVDTLAEHLVRLGRTLPDKAVLLPSGDHHVACLSRHESELREYFHFAVPDPATLELLQDKAAFYRFAQAEGFDIPATFFPRSDAEAHEVAGLIRYPCLLKAHNRDANWTRHFGSRKALAAESPEQLRRLFADVIAVHPEIVVQEVVPGPDHQLFFSHAYLDRDSRPLALWTGRKLRQHPIHFGTSTMAESVRVDEVAEATLALLRRLDYAGYASIEFKWDSRDDRYRIMEVTPGRTWYPHYLGTAAGVNIPFIWYDDLIGGGSSYRPRFVEGAVWIDEYRDLFAGYDYVRAGETTPVQWLRSYGRRMTGALASLRDPAPILFVGLRLGIGGLRVANRALARIPRAFRAARST